MHAIDGVFAREVLDSRGRPTVEVELSVRSVTGRAIVPSGASTGRAEAIELRDGGARYNGLGVEKAVAHVNDAIRPAILGLDVCEQKQLDARMIELDGDPLKRTLGANAILGVSLAALHTSAMLIKTPTWRRAHDLLSRVHPDNAPAPCMPTPMVNMISGGLHAGGNLDFQDVLLIPDSSRPFREQLESTVRTYWRLGELLIENGREGRLVGDEGGYGPRLDGNRQAIETVVEAARQSGLDPGDSATIALDVAATHFFRDGTYQLASEQTAWTPTEMVDSLERWTSNLPIVSIEDGLSEDDWDGWVELTKRLGDRVRLVGDDLFATNCERIQKGISMGAANSVLIKVNQIGTLSETFDAISLCREAGFGFVVSARSGETEDTTIADLAVGVAAPEIKIGSVARSERLAKYNQLLRIEQQLLDQ